MIIEYFFIGLIIIFQIWVFRITLKHISEFENIFSGSNILNIKIKQFNNLPIEKLKNLSTAALVNNNLQKVFDLESEEVALPDSERSPSIQVRLIYRSSDENNPELSKITASLNSYLIRNIGVPTEFSTLQDITNRNLQVLQNRIEQSLPVPLYLGLAGTLLSAFIGLWNYSSSIDINLGSAAIDSMGEVTKSLIKTISVAMLSSLCGVGLTTYVTYMKYRPARFNSEKGLNNFYNFIQADLLPYLSVTAASAIRTLQESLSIFNTQFSKNLEKLNRAFSGSAEAMNIQKQTYEAIERLDLNKLIKASAALSKVMDKVELLGDTLSNTADWLKESQLLVDRVNHLLNSVNGIDRTITSLEFGVSNIQVLNTAISSNVADVAAFARGSSDKINEEIATLSTEFIRHIRDKVVPDLQNHFAEFELKLNQNSHELLTTMKFINGGFQQQQKELIDSLRNEHKNLVKLDKLDKLDKLEILRDMEKSLVSIDRSLKGKSTVVNSKPQSIIDNESYLIQEEKEPRVSFFKKIFSWGKKRK